MTIPPLPPAPADLSKLRINRDAPSQKQKGAVWGNLLFFLLIVVVLGGLYFYFRAANIPVVQVITASANTSGGSAAIGSTSVTANGYVVARTKASVSAKAAGRLEFLGVSEGSHVQKGDVIARLDNADYQAAVAQAQANIATADASVIESRADHEQLTREAKRLSDIRMQNANLVSQQEVDQATSRTAQSIARVNAAEARKHAAEAGLHMAEANNENTVIRAPFTGTVLRKDAEVGEVVAPSVGGGLTRGAVVTMADLSTLEVEVDVNEAYISRIVKGRDARITLDAYPDTAFRGLVRQVVPTADRQRATVQVKVTISDHDARILPEMGAKVDFLAPDSSKGKTAVAPARAIIRIPSTALKSDAGASVVWIVRDEHLSRRVITTGPASGGFLEVRSGLSGGEQLMVSGVDAPKDGLKVKLPSAK